MSAFKIPVPIPPHVRERRRIAAARWDAICGGEWHGAHAWVEPLTVGADIVLLTKNGEVVRWMFASQAAAHGTLSRWNGDGAPIDIDDIAPLEARS